MKKTEYLGYAFLSGSLVLSMTNPIWVVKTRMCLQYETLATQRVPTLTTWGNLVSLWRLEGIKGLYRGFLPALINMSNGAIQFLSPVEYLTMATISKFFADFLDLPFYISIMQTGV
ncbi:unnamed protein product [Dibothriocephalus latus]|uniref:Uncharacterized protein n=1 Tax=Dibothriocephalus latus TaxID=60516 RepID=A0A3P7M279_DIBLA|nr:unnamed protein product [Dibothriocephalus latus]